MTEESTEAELAVGFQETPQKCVADEFDVEAEMEKLNPEQPSVIFGDLSQDGSATRLPNPDEDPKQSQTELKLHVYQSALDILMYTAIQKTVDEHKFEVLTIKRPTYCFHCQNLLWGLHSQGVRCSQCKVKCHDRCKDFLGADCLRRPQKGDDNNAAKILPNLYVQKIDEFAATKQNQFKIMQKIFQVNETDHLEAVNRAKVAAVEFSTKWSAKITLTLVAARDLKAKDSSGTSDPFVTIQLGRETRRSQTKKKTLNPEWNETFVFDCHDVSERLTIRLWDEGNNLTSKVRQTATGEGDDFLGQFFFDVAKLPHNCAEWFELGKRTEKSNVSGAIRLQIVVDVKQDKQPFPIDQQYQCLHEQAFQYFYSIQAYKPPPIGKNEDFGNFFEPNFQHVLDHFAKFHSLSSTFMALIHITCLVSIFTRPFIPQLLKSLLPNIDPTHPVFRNRDDGEIKGIQALETLTVTLAQMQATIRVEFLDFRNRFPATDSLRLRDLLACVDLLKTANILRFKERALGFPISVAWLVEECLVCNVDETFQFLFKNCTELYRKQFHPSPVDSNLTDLLRFWHRLIALIVLVIREDINTYQPIFANKGDGIQFGYISGLLFWQEFTGHLKFAIEQHALNASKINAVDFMHLYFKVQWMYKNYVAVVPTKDIQNPDYPHWFEPFIIKWLCDCEKACLECVKRAYERDKLEGFKNISNTAKYSYSIYDVFSQISQYFKVVKKLDSPDLVRRAYTARFSKVIEEVLLLYAKMVTSDLVEFAKDQTKCCTLLNNMQQAVRFLEKQKDLMGGDLLDNVSTNVFKELKKQLDVYLEQQCKIVVVSFSEQIRGKIQEIAKKVYPNQADKKAGTKSTVMNIDEMLELIVCLETCISNYADHCDSDDILNRICEKLWLTTLEYLESILIFPVDQKMHLPLQHCDVLNAFLKRLKIYFQGEGKGLDEWFLEDTAQFRLLQIAISLMPEKTDDLLKKFVLSQGRQYDVSSTPSFGEINFEIGLQRHGESGKNRFTLKLLSCKNLSWQASSAIRPYVAVSLIGPEIAQRKHKWSTSKVKRATLDPNFNETYQFSLPAKSDVASYELQFSVKDAIFGQNNKVIGLAVIRLNELESSSKRASIVTLPLAGDLRFDVTGMSIIRILHQRRNNDKAAKEFIKLKSEERPVQ